MRSACAAPPLRNGPARAPKSRATVQAYTDGVNAVIANQVRARPPEMLILGVPLQPWDPVDSLAWSIMMAYDLGGNWSAEMLRLRMALKLPVERINELMPPYPGREGAAHGRLSRRCTAPSSSTPAPPPRRSTCSSSA